MLKLPQQGIWRQVNLSDKFGDLWSSFNLNLTKKLGTLSISPRLLLNISTTDDAQLGAPPCAFKVFVTTDTFIWAAANAHMWHSTATGSAGGPSDTFVQDATSGTPTTLNSSQTDLEVFNSALYVSAASTNVYKLAAAGTWSTISNGVANSAGNHAMTFFRAQNKLYIIDDNAAGITSINTSDAIVLSTSDLQYSLNDLVEGAGVNVGSHLSCIDSNSTRIWIGTISQSDNYCRVYAWDGSQASGPNEAYFVDASGILAIEIVDDVPVIFDTKGRLLQLNGGTFVELDRLPLENQSLKLPVSSATGRPVHYNGMRVIDGKINIFINTYLWDTNSTNNERTPSGIWEYTKETGLYHKASVGLSKSGGTITDYGQQKLSLVGAIAEVEVISTDITQGSVNGKFLLGCTYYTDATTTLSGIFYDDTNDTLQKYGYFVTRKIFSDNITDSWQKVYLRIKKLLDSGDLISVKYRTSEDASQEGTITWLDDHSFVVSSTITIDDAGDEVEILQGTGSGKTGHITSHTVADAGNHLVSMQDDTFTGVTTGTAKARFQTWKRAGALFNNQNDEIPSFPLEGKTSWIQLKVCLQNKGKDELNDVILINSVGQK